MCWGTLTPFFFCATRKPAYRGNLLAGLENVNPIFSGDQRSLLTETTCCVCWEMLTPFFLCATRKYACRDNSMCFLGMLAPFSFWQAAKPVYRDNMLHRSLFPETAYSSMGNVNPTLFLVNRDTVSLTGEQRHQFAETTCCVSWGMFFSIIFLFDKEACL